MTQRDLIDKRSRIMTEMTDFVNQLKVEGLSEARRAELDESFNRAEKEHAEISKQIQRMQTIEELQKQEVDKAVSQAEQRARETGTDPKSGKAEYRDAFLKMIAWGVGKLTAEERHTLETRGTSTQIAGTTTLGGYTVPTDLQNQIFEAMKDYSGIMQAATIFNTDSGNPINWPFTDQTAAKAVLIAESGAFTVQDTTFSQVAMSAYKFGDLVKISSELLQDSAFDLPGFFSRRMATGFGRALNDYATTGTGSSQPQGIVTGATLGKTTASATAITFGEVIDLKHSVDPAYRNGPNTGFMFNDVVLAYLKKLSVGSSDARPLWQPSFVVGQPDTVDGSRYWINQSMDSTINTASKIMLYGDFSKFLIRVSRGFEIKRNDALYMNTDEVGFYGVARFDSKLTDTTAVKYMLTA